MNLLNIKKLTYHLKSFKHTINFRTRLTTSWRKW